MIPIELHRKTDHELVTEILALREALEEIRDLAHTDLPPDNINMSAVGWNTRRISKIAWMADKALSKTEVVSDVR